MGLSVLSRRSSGAGIGMWIVCKFRQVVQTVSRSVERSVMVVWDLCGVRKAVIEICVREVERDARRRVRKVAV